MMRDECQICYQYMYLIELDNCNHYYCHECLQNYIINKIDESEHEIKCPQWDCDEILSYTFINDMIDDTYIKKLDRNIVKYTVNSSYNLKFCPKCDNVCEKDYNDTVNCDNCNYIFCYLCGYKKTYEHECNFDILDEIKDALEFNYDDERELKLCPKCRTIIHRYGGCYSVKCSNCRFRFCWNCLKLDKDIQDRETHRETCYEYNGFDEKDSPDPSDDDSDY